MTLDAINTDPVPVAGGLDTLNTDPVPVVYPQIAGLNTDPVPGPKK